eukprot:2592985-Amphidinium_carterae.1
MLSKNFDRIVFLGLTDKELQAAALLVIVDWAESLFPPAKGGKPAELSHVAVANVCRFLSQLTQVIRTCLYDGDAVSFTFHRQLAQVLSDLCSTHAARLVHLLQGVELGKIWEALLHFSRYPSLKVQHDAVVGMRYLAQAHVSHSRACLAPPRPSLEELVGVLYVHSIKGALYGNTEIDAQRSAWILRCLGRCSTAEQPGSVVQWHSMINDAFALDCLDGQASAEERTQLFGHLKGQSMILLRTISDNVNTVSSPEGFQGLLRVTAQLMQRALGGSRNADSSGSPFLLSTGQELSLPWWPEFDAAAALMESSAANILKIIEDDAAQANHTNILSHPHLQAVLAPTAELLQCVLQWTPVGLDVSSDGASTIADSVQDRQFELVSHLTSFYRYLPAVHMDTILQRIMTTVASRKEGSPLQRRCLATLTALARSGAMSKEQTEGLHRQCSQLLPQLGPGATGSFCEAIAAAVVGVDLEAAQKAALIDSLLHDTSQKWCGSPLSQRLQPEAVATILLGPDGGMKLADVRGALRIFLSVLQAAVPDGKKGRHKASASPNVLTDV